MTVCREKVYVLILILLLPFTRLTAQNTLTWQQIIDEWADIDEENAQDWENTYDLLEDLSEHPIDINTANREELEQLPFLDSRQISAILDYRKQQGGIVSMSEMVLIPQMDDITLRLMQCFFTCDTLQNNGTHAAHPTSRNSGHELIGTIRMPLYSRQGNREGYLGQRYRHSLRYKYQYGNSIKAGLMAAQDAGEPFFKGRNKWGYDYYSPYISIKNMGRVKSIVAGRYRMSTGLGLILNANFNAGKVAQMARMSGISTKMQPHSSRSEANYMQGAAVKIDMGRGFSITPFLSYRAIDATLTADEDGIRTLLTSGYHRTESEMSRKHNAKEIIGGGNFEVSKGEIGFSLTAIGYGFNKPLMPNTSPLYRLYNPQGKHFWNASIAYTVPVSIFNVTGEIATGDSKQVAMLHKISTSIKEKWVFTGLWRHYPYRFHALHGNSYSEGGSVQNETGGAVSITWHPANHLTLSAMSDFARFAWPRYGISTTSHSWDHRFELAYTPKHWSLAARYRYKTRQHDNAERNGVDTYSTHRWRLSGSRTIRHWQAKTQLDMVYACQQSNSFGWIIQQQIGRSHRNWQWFAAFGFFKTNDYASRIYVYERSMLYDYPYHSIYGKGIRYLAYGKMKLLPTLMLACKVAVTDYFDRKSISSGLQQIDHSSQTDIDLQLKWTF